MWLCTSYVYFYLPFAMETTPRAFQYVWFALSSMIAFFTHCQNRAKPKQPVKTHLHESITNDWFQVRSCTCMAFSSRGCWSSSGYRHLSSLDWWQKFRPRSHHRLGASGMSFKARPKHLVKHRFITEHYFIFLIFNGKAHSLLFAI